MKRLLGIGLVAAMVAIGGANSAQALSIGLNFADGGESYVPGWITGPSAGYVLQGSWYNIDGASGASIENLSIGGLTLNLVTGAGTQYGVDLSGNNYPSGWNNNPANVPGSVGIGSVQSFTIENIPYAKYDVAIMVGAYWCDVTWDMIDGGNGSVSRSTPEGQLSFSGATSGAKGSTFTFTGNDTTAVYAIQIMEATATPEPGTIVLLGSLLGLGAIGGLRKRFFGAKKSVVA